MSPPLLLLLLLQSIHHVRSQTTSPPPYQYANFNPSIITIIIILISALLLMTFFTIYIRRISNNGGSLRTALSIRRATPASRGLDPSVIGTFPTFVYSTVKSHKIGKGSLECAVCLNEYEDEETLRLIPKCDHVFHPECIDAWFENHVTCPVCRANLVPDPDESQLGLDHSTDQNNQNDDASVSITVSDSVSVSDQQNQSVSVKPTLPNGPKLFQKFRSHSTGHSLVQPGENLDRFTLRLPADVRKQVVNRAVLNRMVGEGSGKNGYRVDGGINGRRKSYKRLESLDRVMVRSERWVMSRAPSFLTRALSIRSPRIFSGNGEASTSSTTPKGSKTVDKIPLNMFGPKSC
ncbi:hypothetical protein QVD17_19001 [Tagetes erecta]|uniref:RING-type E3 ubiquitin transferase n=1 Tax=Tagetes erecta TaxID=13708 RepID=A0AAD8NW58_TARER|nr:hypothetical protein QVD17_19001 [Tagetes erecta]